MRNFIIISILTIGLVGCAGKTSEHTGADSTKKDTTVKVVQKVDTVKKDSVKK